mgnify:FL=1
MGIILTLSSARLPGPAVDFECPSCGLGAVGGESHTQVDTVRAFFLIPLWRHHNTYVVCPSCTRRFRAPAGLDELSQLDANELTVLLGSGTSFNAKAYALVALAFCWAPLVGLVMRLVATVITRRVRGWPRTVSRIALGVSILMFVVLFVPTVAVSVIKLFM